MKFSSSNGQMPLLEEIELPLDCQTKAFFQAFGRQVTESLRSGPFPSPGTTCYPPSIMFSNAHIIIKGISVNPHSGSESLHFPNVSESSIYPANIVAGDMIEGKALKRRAKAVSPSLSPVQLRFHESVYGGNAMSFVEQT